MSKFTEFYKKAVANDASKNELTAILGNKEFREATDEQLEKLSGLAKKLGFDITVEEAKAYLNGVNAELDDDELDAVAGGFDKHGHATDSSDWKYMVIHEIDEDGGNIGEVAKKRNVPENELKMYWLNWKYGIGK